MSIESPGFHAREGWFFRREPDGSVRLQAPDSAGPGAHQTVVLDANTWASAVASVCLAGENGTTYRRALAYHSDEGADVDRVAQAAYAAYGEATGRKNVRGEAMPAWEDLGGVIQSAWRASVRAAG